MNIVLQLPQFHIDNVFFLDKKKNMIMDGNFTILIYSNQWFSMNGLYIESPIIPSSSSNVFQPVPRKHSSTFTTTPTRYRNNDLYIDDFDLLHFSSSTNSNLIHSLYSIEHEILQYYNIAKQCDKKMIHLLYKSVSSGIIKVYNKHGNVWGNRVIGNRIMIKISGIWESQNNIGLTYKFIRG